MLYQNTKNNCKTLAINNYFLTKGIRSGPLSKQTKSRIYTAFCISTPTGNP